MIKSSTTILIADEKATEHPMTDAPPTLDLDDLAMALAVLQRGNGWNGDYPLPWSVWTSCSFRRIGCDATGGDGDVLHGTTQPSDNHPDLSMSGDRLGAWVELTNAAPALIAEVRRLREEVASSLREVTRCAAEAGMWKGRYEGSHMCGVLDGWRERALAAEAQRDEAREALRACRDQFAFYADEHRKAGKREKALTNQAFADRADEALGVIEGQKA